MLSSSASLKHSAHSNAAIDILKFLFSILIAALHSGVDLGILTPLYRLGVPFFFITSSYYLFSKINIQHTDHERNITMLQFVKRNARLYLFWFILWLPLLLKLRTDWFASNLIVNILVFLRSLLFGSTFSASWYIAALILDCFLIYHLSKKLPTTKLLIIGLVSFVICLAYSTYYGITRNFLFLRYCLTGFITIFNSVVTGFPAGILWIALGKYFAENHFQTRPHHYLMLIGGFILLLLENQMVTHFDWVLVNDCYVMLLPVCYALFQIVRNSTLSWKPSILLRNYSTMIYTSHGIFINTLTPILAALFAPSFDNAWESFFITIVLCMILGTMLLALKKIKVLSWLKYSH